MLLLRKTHWELMSRLLVTIKAIKKEGERERGKRKRDIVCSPLPPCVLAHSSEHDINSPPREPPFLFSSSLHPLLLLELSPALFLFVSNFPMMELFVLLGVPSHTHSITYTAINLRLNNPRVSYRMIQNNQLERLPDDAPWDLPSLLSL